MLPDGWTEAKLNELGTINAQAVPENTPADYEFYYLDLSAVKEGKIDFPSETTTFESAPSRARRIIRDGDILLATVRPNLQGYALAKNLPPNTIGSTGFAVITAKPKADAAFIYQALSGGDVQGQIQALVVGSNYPAINGSDVKNLNILTPPLSEQKRISEVLGSVDAAIEATKAVIDQTKTVKQGLLQTLLTRGIGHTKFKDSSLGEIPETWEVKALGKIGEFTNGINKGKEDFGHGVPFINIGDIFGKNSVSAAPENLVNATSTEVKNYSLLKGDVLFVRSSVKPSGVGLTSAVMNHLPNVVFSGFIIRFRPKPEIFTPKFLKYLFYTDTFRNSLLNKSTISANTNINQKALETLPVAVPKIGEQDRIAEILDSLESQTLAEETKLATLQTLKTGLMNDLLTGKVRVEVASTAETQASNVLPFALTSPVDAVRKHALLSAEITAQLYHLPTFGATKREKLTDLVVRHVGLDETTDRQASRHAAGSYDPRARREIDDIFERENWFKIQRSASAVKFIKGTAFGGHKDEFDDQFGSVKLQVQKVINLLRDYDTRHCEIIDTLYTAWNDFLIEGKSPSDDEIITEVLTNWHDSKLNISRQDWRSGLSWMRERDFVPSGRGRSTKAPSFL